MMNMMVANIGSEPGHDRSRLQETGRLHRRFVVRPATFVVERHAREVVLSVKQITSYRAGDKVWNDQCEQESRPAKKPGNRCRKQQMPQEGYQAVIVFPQLGHRRIETHSILKYENIPEQDRHWMAHKQVFEALGLR